MGTQPLPDGSCFSCGDSALSITASILGILTFFYAVLVGVRFYYVSLLDAEEQMRATMKSLETSFREARDISITLESMTPEHSTSEPRPEDDSVKELVYNAGRQLSDLAAMTRKFMDSGRYGSLGRIWRRRVRFVIIQEELQKKIAEKDQMMGDLRQMRLKYEKSIDDDKQQYFHMANEEVLRQVRSEQQNILDEILKGQRLLNDTMRERLDKIEARQNMSEEPVLAPDPNIGHE